MFAFKFATIITALAISGCAGTSINESAAKYADNDVAGFLKWHVTYDKQAYGRPMFRAYFNEVNSSRLYVPAGRLELFCKAKGGTWEVDSKQTVRSAYDSSIQIIMLSESKKIAGAHKEAYNKAMREGALGTFKCTKSGAPIWAVRIENGNYTTDSTLGFNSVMQLIIGTHSFPTNGS